MKIKQNLKSIVFVSFAIVMFSQNSYASNVVITNKATNVDSLSAKEVKALFLKKKKNLPNGAKAIIGDQDTDSSSYKSFAKNILGKSTKKLKSYWSKRVFSGKGKPPKNIGNDEKMKKWIATTPNALGYIDESSVDESIKVILKP